MHWANIRMQITWKEDVGWRMEEEKDGAGGGRKEARWRKTRHFFCCERNRTPCLLVIANLVQVYLSMPRSGIPCHGVACPATEWQAFQYPATEWHALPRNGKPSHTLPRSGIPATEWKAFPYSATEWHALPRNGKPSHTLPRSGIPATDGQAFPYSV